MEKMAQSWTLCVAPSCRSPGSLQVAPARIEDLEEEVAVVRVSLACPPRRLDHAVGPFDPAVADMAARLRDDSLHVSLHEPGEPFEVPVPGAAARVHDPLHGSAHRIRIGARIGLHEHLIYDVAGGKELVLGYEVLVALPGPSLLQDQRGHPGSSSS